MSECWIERGSDMIFIMDDIKIPALTANVRAGFVVVIFCENGSWFL